MPASLLPDYTSYVLSASSWWQANSASIIWLAEECPTVWYKASNFGVFGGNVYLNHTLINMECFAEANPTDTLSTAGPTATPRPGPTWGDSTATRTTTSTTTTSNSSSSSSTPPLPSPTDECSDGAGPGGLAGLCSWACSHGFCPLPCTCTPGTSAALPPPTGDRGYAFLDLQNEPGFPVLCDFVCSYADGYCPEQVCAKIPYTPEPAPGAGAVRVQGRGEGSLAGLCSYACRFGYCPPGPCECTLYGQAIQEPPVLGTLGEPAPGLDGSYKGLCSFACNHGYCPTGLCVYST